MPDRSDPLAQILDLADDVIIISFDRQRSILRFNRGAQKMFDYSVKEVRGKNLDILLPARLAGTYREYVERSGKTGARAPQTGQWREISGQRKDGSEFLAEAFVTHVEVGGEPVYTLFLHDITQRAMAEERLRNALREKELLVDEIHHRVKNNLQVITSLLGLQARSTLDADTQKKFQESQQRVQSMAILHEILFQSGSLARIDFAEYIRRLTAHLVRSYGVTGEIRLRLDLHSASLPVDAAVPCGLIVNELLSNAFKYAFPAKSGEVRIDLRQEPDGAIRLVVADDGIGLPRDFNWETSPSLGLRLVRTLVKQLDAAIEADRSQGTAFCITFRAGAPVTFK